MRPHLSVIIPAYNEAERLPPKLRAAADFLSRQPWSAEIIVVENGSTDGTAAAVESVAGEERRCAVKLLRGTGQGKGSAVRQGMLAAEGEYRLFSDADFAVPPEEIPKFLPPQTGDDVIAIGNRELPGSVRRGEPFYRHIMGKVFNAVVRLLVLPKITDTQCGFKCFSRRAAETVFSRQQITGWGFDVELIVIAQKHKFSVAEIPVYWENGGGSKISPLKDAVGMFQDVLAVRKNARAGVYNPPD